MKKLIVPMLAAASLAACAQTQSDKSAQNASESQVGMANPASEFCIKQGGKLEMRKDKDSGEYAMCHLPDGKVVEEWEYFRANNPAPKK